MTILTNDGDLTETFIFSFLFKQKCLIISFFPGEFYFGKKICNNSLVSYRDTPVFGFYQDANVRKWGWLHKTDHKSNNTKVVTKVGSLLP